MDKNLTVCLLNDSFPPVIDGVANAVYNYAEIIDRCYGSAVVCTPEYPGADYNHPFRVFSYPSVKTPKFGGYRTGIPLVPIKMREFAKQNVDVIHTHCPFASTVMARMLRAQIHKPVIFSYHTKFDIDIAQTFDSEIIQRQVINFVTANIEQSDEVWVVSKGAGENLRGLGYSGEFHVMENGVDFPKGRSEEVGIEAVRCSHGLDPDVPVFLFVGRMRWYKGIRIILDGLFRAKALGSNFKMMFIGGGDDFSDIVQYAEALGLSGDCIFTGPISDREALRAYFSVCDMFLFPSTYDTNGIVVREAAACGAASVLVRDSAAAEGVSDGRNGILIDENAESLASAVVSLSGNRSVMKALGERAQAELYLSWEAAVGRAYERYKVVDEKFRSGLDLGSHKKRKPRERKA